MLSGDSSIIKSLDTRTNDFSNHLECARNGPTAKTTAASWLAQLVEQSHGVGEQGVTDMN